MYARHARCARYRPLARQCWRAYCRSMIDPTSPVPRWQQVAEIIRQRIADGTYPAGSRVPSVVQLQAEFGIAQATAQKTLSRLREDGVLYTVPGLGSFVAGP